MKKQTSVDYNSVYHLNLVLFCFKTVQVENRFSLPVKKIVLTLSKFNICLYCCLRFIKDVMKVKTYKRNKLAVTRVNKNVNKPSYTLVWHSVVDKAIYWSYWINNLNFLVNLQHVSSCELLHNISA